MKDQLPSELLAQRPVRSDYARAGLSYATRRMMTVAVILLLSAAGLYLAFGRTSPAGPEQIPVIKAEGSYKQKPVQPGGIDIPHQDVQIYQQIDNNEPGKPVIEHLLPPPETPEPVPAQLETVTAPSAPTGASLASQGTATGAAGLPATASKAPKTEVISTDSVMAPGSTPTIATTVASAPSATMPSVEATSVPKMPASASDTQSQVTSDVVPAKPAAKTASKTTPKTIEQVLADVSGQSPETPSTVMASKGPIIQLASIPDPVAAQDALNKLQLKYATILGPMQLRLVKADLGDKGIFYRIQGQAASDDQANHVCTSIKRLKAGCIVVGH